MAIKISAHHMSFPVSDLDRSRAFYENVLGLNPIPRPDLGRLRGIWYAAGDCEVHLIETPAGADVGETPPSLNPLARHAAFAIEDYEDALSQLRDQNFEIVENRKAGQMWICDPDGHIIELIVPGQSKIE
jgi:catechol 2,3-dioxygenase-like lactoylglutathione lyase family enzyme